VRAALVVLGWTATLAAAACVGMLIGLHLAGDPVPIYHMGASEPCAPQAPLDEPPMLPTPKLDGPRYHA